MRRFCSWRRFTPCALAMFLASGCGPLFLPMTTRLAEEDQKTVDGMWANLLTPVNRVDHQTLLDTTLVYMLFQLGVDKLHLVSEKHVPNGKVVMEIDCDRASPATDQFTVTISDDRGRTLRRERYSRQEVEDSADALRYSSTTQPSEAPTGEHGRNSTQPTTRPSTQRAPATTTQTSDEETPEHRRHRVEYERRMKAVETATQPAVVR